MYATCNMQELCNLLVVDWSNTVSHTYTQVTILLAALNTVLIGLMELSWICATGFVVR